MRAVIDKRIKHAYISYRLIQGRYEGIQGIYEGVSAMYNKKSLENLTPFNQMDEEQHRKISRLGGKAAGVTRRHRAQLREMWNAYNKYGKSFKAIEEMDVDAIIKLLK